MLISKNNDFYGIKSVDIYGNILTITYCVVILQEMLNLTKTCIQIVITEKRYILK